MHADLSQMSSVVYTWWISFVVGKKLLSMRMHINRQRCVCVCVCVTLWKWMALAKIRLFPTSCGAVCIQRSVKNRLWCSVFTLRTPHHAITYSVSLCMQRRHQIIVNRWIPSNLEAFSYQVRNCVYKYLPNCCMSQNTFHFFDAI